MTTLNRIYKSVLPCAALLAVTAAYNAMQARDIPVTKYNAAPDVLIPLPATPDSVDGGKKFDASRLLVSKKAQDYFHRLYSPDWTTILPDTAGVIHADGADGDRARLHVLTTRMRPQKFVKGKLCAKSNVLAEVFVNGESKMKQTRADSVANEFSTPVQLNPEEDVEIEIHLLAMPADPAKPEFSLTFVTDKEYDDVETSISPDGERRFTINTTTLGGRLNKTSISPDGKYITLSFTETYGEKDSRSWTTLRETASERTVATVLPDGARWMPEGSTLFFTERSGNANALYRMEVPSMRRTLIADNVPVSADEIEWAPDCTWFAYADSDEGTKETGVMRRIKSPDDRIPGDRHRSYLMRHDIRTGVSSPLTYGGPSTTLYGISPDSKKILYIATRQTPSKYPFYNVSLIQEDVETLRTDTIVANSGGLAGAAYSPDGKKVLMWGGPNEFDGIGMNVGDHEMGNDFDVQLFLMDLADRKVKPLTKDFDPSVKGHPVWNKADGKIYFTADEGFYATLYQLDPANGTFTKLPTQVDYIRDFSIGDRESRYISYCGMGLEYIGRGYIMDLKNRRNTLLADPMGQEMNALNLGKSETWTFTTADGTTIDGMITLPPDFDPTKKYPLIVYYYAGTTPSIRAMHSPYAPQLFAARDYVVYVLNPSGTIGYGQEFSARHVNAWGQRTADEIIEGVKKLCDTHDFIDRKHIGCIGASYGGFMTQLLQTKTDIFAAAVSHAGISNVTSYWGEGYWGYTYNSVAAAKSYPWTNPELFTRQGSLFNADKIHTPLLLLHGTRDTNVPIGESIQLFNALKILDREVEFITVEDQDHIITDFNKRKLWHATIMAWFAKWLQDDPRWWNSMYGEK